MPLFVDINGLSKHFGGRYEYNEVNPGIGVTYETVNDRLVKGLLAGTFENSFNDRSNYLGGLLARRFGNGKYYIDLGASAGLLSGYEKDITPMAGLLAQIGKKDLGRLRFQYVPRKDDRSPALLMINLGIPFK